MVHSIMRHVAETTGSNLEQLYTEVAWPLYRLYGHAYNAFAGMVTDADADAGGWVLAWPRHQGVADVLDVWVADRACGACASNDHRSRWLMQPAPDQGI